MLQPFRSHALLPPGSASPSLCPNVTLSPSTSRMFVISLQDLCVSAKVAFQTDLKKKTNVETSTTVEKVR